MTRTELFQKLKAKRKEIADREGVELFMILTNKALEETVKAMPATLEDLALVKGWGKTKIARYGADVLRVLLSDDDKQTNSVRDETHDAVFTVSEFLEAVNITLSRLGTVRVRGEVSEMRHRGSVVYFTLKDTSGEEANVKCVLWASKYEREYGYLEDGMEIVIDALPEIYAKFGAFDVRVEKIEPVGEGALRKAFEALKKKLGEKGYFGEKRKRPLPVIIQRIGIITSEKGEAINDFLKNIGEFGFEILLRDVRVEGDQAVDSIVEAFREFNAARISVDVLCLIRGGGSLENLQAFNSERVAAVVVSSRIPVLTGIGHERDVTIAALSSDADFSTPTKVADAIRRGRENILRHIERQGDAMALTAGELLRDTTRAFLLLEEELRRLPDEIMERMRTRISARSRQLGSVFGNIFSSFHSVERAFMKALQLVHSRLQNAEHGISLNVQRMQDRMERVFQSKDKRLSVAGAALLPLDPISPLRRGYSIAYGKTGTVLKSAQDVIVGEHIRVRLYRGIIKSRVEDINQMNHES
ncbi:MAG: Exodeoxyribonuclease 7 large subunit [Parcubacteria group bacterium Gr01-1014_70]|nr:MAG: Exodeoxyribonuclease 7 large subunit [Parcubacteria group bacterium Gr01-1014_70]